MTTQTIAAAVLASLAFMGCTGPKSADEAVSDVVSDRQLLAEAESAANEVVRSAGDCDAVNAAFSSAMAKLDETEGKVQTAVGRTTLESLRKQVRTIGEACGAH
jgi:outer membrane murein-binding lipoprotein Lpp